MYSLIKAVNKKVNNTSYEKFSKRNNGYISWFNYDIVNARDSIGQFYFAIETIFSSLIIIIFIYFLSSWSWIISLVVVGFLFLSTIIQILVQSFLKKLIQNIMEANEKFSKMLINIFDRFNIFFLFNKTFLFANKAKKSSELLYNTELDIQKKQIFIFIIFWFITLVSVLITLIIIIVLINHNYLSIFIFLSLFIYSTNFLNVGSEAVGQVFVIGQLKPIFKKIFEYNLENNNLLKIYLKEPIKKIKIKNLSYKYYDFENEVLKNINLEILKNKKYAIIAKSGRGKSTLLKIISGAITNFEGEILINDKYSLKELNINYVRENIGLIDNKNVVFYDSLKNNISLLNSNFDENKYNDVCEKYGIKNLNKTPKITWKNLSEGEKQKINLARIDYSSLPIWLLDEALDNVDKVWTDKIYKSILANSSLTLILVTHHLDLKFFNKFDEIIYL